jgi:hypothetical protein
MSISNVSALPNSTVVSVRTAAIAGIAGAGITIVGGFVVQAVVQPSTSVSDELWSYPWSSAGLVRISLLWALAHALVLVGLVGFARSGAAGTRRAARYGLVAVFTGTALLLLGELASILVRHEHTDATGAIAVAAVFSLGAVLSAAGFLLVGWETRRTERWHGWRRSTPLATGVWCIALIGVSATKALPTGVGIYGLCLLALFAALYGAPARREVSDR